MLTDALSKRIEAETPYKIISVRDNADTELTGKIVTITESILSTERDTGLALEKMIKVKAVVNWKNLKTGRLLIDNKTIIASATYTEFMAQDIGYVKTLAANKLAEKIVELMENKW